MAAPPYRRRLVGFSTKMYFTPARTLTYHKALTRLLPTPPPNADIFLAADFLSLPLLPTNPLLLAAQNCAPEDAGAFTGEVSPLSLAQLGVRIVELGHAERRRSFHETEDVVVSKARAVVRNGMIPLICVGEERQVTPGEAVRECTPLLKRLVETLGEEGELAVAYEPIWAIGAQEPAEEGYVREVVQGLRKVVGKRVRILYGGRAKEGLWGRLEEEGGVDGLFLGRFAHQVESFVRIVKEVTGEA